MKKWFLYIPVIGFNGLIVVVLIFLQFLMFSFLEAIDPATPIIEQRNVALSFVIQKSVSLTAELAVGLLISFAINRGIFNLPLKKNVLVLLAEFVIVLVSMILFTFNYITKFG